MIQHEQVQGPNRLGLAIRKADQSDRPALHDLLHASWMTTWAPSCPEEAVAQFRQTDPVAGYLDACLELIDIGLLNDRIVAAMHIEADHLAALHVAPDQKGRGIGSAMMDEAEARGARRLEVRAFNFSAIRFYEARGWERSRSYSGTEMGAPMETHEYMRTAPDAGRQDPAEAGIVSSDPCGSRTR